MAQQQNNTKQQTQAANSKAEQMAQAVEKDLKNTPAPQQNAAMEPKGEPQNNTVEPQQELQNNVVEPQGEKEEENALNSAVNAVAAQGTLTPYPEDNGVVNDSASAEEMGTPPAENNGSDNNQVSNEPNPADKSDRNDSEEGERSDSKEQKKG